MNAIPNRGRRNAAIISTSIGQFFSGDVDPSIPHLVLILAAVMGGLAVGVGIVWESARDGHLWTLPTALVLIGVVVEAAATVILFEFDEGISHSQQARIILLDSELAKVRLPRSLSQDAIQRIAARLRKFEGTPFDLSVTPDAEESFAEDIRRTLDFAHWDHLRFGGFAWSFDELRVRDGLPHAGIAASIVGVRALYEDPSLENAAEELAKALTDEGFDAKAQAISGLANGSPPIKPNVMHIQIGSRV